MTDYSTLQSDILTWSTRSEFSAQAPSFIRNAEAEIARKVRVLEMETDALLVLTLVSGTYQANLPTGFLGFRHVFVSGASNPRADYVSPDQFHELNNLPNDGFSSRLDRSLIYTIESNKIKGDSPAGATDPITLNVSYFQRFDALSDTNTTNLMLINNYDIYLYASLANLWRYAMSSEQEAKYVALFDRAVNDLHEAEKKRRSGGGPLVRRPPLKNVV